MEANQVSSDGWMNKQSVIHIYKEYHSALKGKSDIYYNKNEPSEDIMLCDKPVTGRQILYDSIYLE